jgi:hypothetical protein
MYVLGCLEIIIIIIIIIYIIIIILDQRQFFGHSFQDMAWKLDEKSFNSLEEMLIFSSPKYRDRLRSPSSHQFSQNSGTIRRGGSDQSPSSSAH